MSQAVQESYLPSDTASHCRQLEYMMLTVVIYEGMAL